MSRKLRLQSAPKKLPTQSTLRDGAEDAPTLNTTIASSDAVDVQTRTSLIDLPGDILLEIFTYLIPQGKTFRIKTLREWNEKNGYANVWPDRLDTSYYSWSEKKYVQWNQTTYGARSKVSPFLAIHPITYALAARLLYSSNIFWFPDLYTLREYSRRFSPSVKAEIRTMAVEACGAHAWRKHSANKRFEFEVVDLDIADIVKEFSGLTDLRLGAVGPGISGRVRCSDTWTKRPRRLLANGATHKDYWPPGPVCQERHDDYRIWSTHCIDLIAQIVGITPPQLDHDEQALSVSVIPRQEERRGPFFGGHVICAKMCEDDYFFYGTERYRKMGTRIMRSDQVIDLGPKETILQDISALYKAAKEEDAKREELERRRNMDDKTLKALRYEALSLIRQGERIN